MSEPTERERLRTAEEALSLAMLRLGGEAPSTVYDERGYAIWVASVAADITEPFRTALRAADDRAIAAESSLTRYKTALERIERNGDAHDAPIARDALFTAESLAALEESPEKTRKTPEP